MNAIWVMALALVALSVGYRWYGRLLSRVFGIDPKRPTPAHTKRDGVDYVPAKHWTVLFGHHFSSICGAGPIVGPALAVAYWGWGPSLIWLLIGAVFMGAVSDFSALVVSVRSEGKSIPEVARFEISPRARLGFSIFIWLSLVLVIAVFAIFSAKTFVKQPGAIVPSWGLIPIALLAGWMLYRTRIPAWVSTVVGLGLLVGALSLGSQVSVGMPSVAGIDPQSLWIWLLLAYCFIASVIPVNILLQPRDYLASFLLFACIGIGVISVFIQQPVMDSVPLYTVNAASAGPIWPMLFVTIACGAISGFHSLVSSGTTCKQLGTEAHACRIGYGGMLLEGLVGVLVVICVGAALTRSELTTTLASGGPIAAFGQGYGNLSRSILGGYGTVFAVVALNAFLFTTLDTATRIARYLTTELFGIRSKYLATALVVGAAGWMALTGQWAKIWPAFGTSNQLIAALALLVASCWLLKRGRPALYTLIPAILMLATTLGAFVYQLAAAVGGMGGKPDWLIAGVVIFLMVLAVFVSVEAFRIIRNPTTAKE